MRNLLLIFNLVIFMQLISSTIDLNVANNLPLRRLTEYLVTAEGYAFEEYSVITKDGYILKFFRIPGSEKSPPAEGKPVVFLMHGILNSSKDWLILGPNKSLAYILADEGFDVFIGNCRGNTYGKRHIKYPTDGFLFWNFSWHHIGAYDLPAMIDLILSITNQKSLHYVGHSQGTSTFFVAASLYPDFNEKIKTMHAFAPIAFLSRMKSPGMRAVAFAYENLEQVFESTGRYEFIPNGELVALSTMNLCREGSLFQEICVNSIFLVCGYDSELLNRTLLPLVLRHSPTGTSMFQITHYAQAMRSGRFAWYDYGIVRNMYIYGNMDPPSYDLSSITVPVYLHYSDNDWLVSLADVRELKSKLGNHVETRRIPYKKFNHLDYVYGYGVNKLLYDYVVDKIKEDERV